MTDKQKPEVAGFAADVINYMAHKLGVHPKDVLGHRKGCQWVSAAKAGVAYVMLGCRPQLTVQTVAACLGHKSRKTVYYHLALAKKSREQSDLFRRMTDNAMRKFCPQVLHTFERGQPPADLP